MHPQLARRTTPADSSAIPAAPPALDTTALVAYQLASPVISGSREEARAAALVAALQLPRDYQRTEARAGGVVMRELGRYYHILEHNLASVCLEPSEACLLIDVTNGWAIDAPDSALHLWMEVEDAIALDGAAEKWGLDDAQATALVAKVRAFTPAQTLAVVDACERAWLGPMDVPLDTRLRAVGLLRG
jgi:hypothetical protein